MFDIRHASLRNHKYTGQSQITMLEGKYQRLDHLGWKINSVDNSANPDI